jgi:hypothetical protein
MEGDQEYRYAGLTLCRAGDWNGDGIEDVVAGAPGQGSLQSTTHQSGAYVFSGSDGSTLRFFDGVAYTQQSSAFGWSIASGKDVNGDGVPDLIVGAPNEPFPAARGSALLFSGATGGLLWEYRGEHAYDKSAYQVALIDDHNGDGLDDWMVLSYQYEPPGSTTPQEDGRLSVFAGAFGDIDSACSGGPNSVGAGAILWNSGPISVRENALELVVSEMPQATPTILIHGRGLTPAQPFGAGELCLPQPLALLAVVTTGSGAPGTSHFAKVALDLDAPPFTRGGNVVHPGDTWAFQALYRQQGQRNTSNALDVVFVP